MPSYELILRVPGERDECFTIANGGVVIGRSPSADVVLTDPLVSREHAWVGLEEGGLVAKDNGSRNGITVNGERYEHCVLKDGDMIGVGEHVLVVRKCKPLNDDSTLISDQEATAIYESILAEDQEGRLPILYKAAELSGEIFDLDELLGRILALIFENLAVRRGFILTVDKAVNEPEVRAQRVGAGGGPELPLSKTLIDHVFRNQTAVLTHDAREDERFDTSESIVGYEIQQAMCAPLHGRRGCVGAIYVDRALDMTRFTSDDLELLTAIGRVVGTAVENAQLYMENINRERLAAIGEATAGLGHCVKNILTGIKAGGEYMDMALQEKNFTYVERGWPFVRRATDRIEMLMMNLLTYSREREPQLSPSNINDLAAEVIEVVRSRADKVNVSIALQAEAVKPVMMDSREIYRVVLNLITNAIEACDAADRDDKTVVVKTATESSGCTVEVTDNGIGIPPEIMNKLSQAFVTTKGSSGTGLGLACSYKIAQEHGGDIFVTSEPGHGSTFSLFLPIKTMAAAKTASDLD